MARCGAPWQAEAWLQMGGEGGSGFSPPPCPSLPQALLGGIESRCSSGGLSAAQRAAAAAALSPAFAARSATPKRGSGSGSGGGDAAGSAPSRHYTAADYRAAYLSGRITPSDVSENIIEAVAASEAQVGLCGFGSCCTCAVHGGGLAGCRQGARLSRFMPLKRGMPTPPQFESLTTRGPPPKLPAVPAHALLRGAQPRAAAPGGCRLHAALAVGPPAVAAGRSAVCGCVLVVVVAAHLAGCCSILTACECWRQPATVWRKPLHKPPAVNDQAAHEPPACGAHLCSEGLHGCAALPHHCGDRLHGGLVGGEAYAWCHAW